MNTIQGITATKVSGFYISNRHDNDWSNLKIEQIGKYKGAYCLDGVDDFITIPTGGIKFAETTYLTNAVNAKTCRH